MRHEIKDGSYCLMDNDNGKILLKVTPSDLPGNQVVIETENEVFAGPIKFLSLSKIDL